VGDGSKNGRLKVIQIFRKVSIEDVEWSEVAEGRIQWWFFHESKFIFWCSQ